jgi:hypothetical protein
MIIYCVIIKQNVKWFRGFESHLHIDCVIKKISTWSWICRHQKEKKNYNVLEVLKSVWETINIVFIHHTSPWWRFTEKSIFTQFLSSDVSLISYIDGYSTSQQQQKRRRRTRTRRRRRPLPSPRPRRRPGCCSVDSRRPWRPAPPASAEELGAPRPSTSPTASQGSVSTRLTTTPPPQRSGRAAAGESGAGAGQEEKY